MFQSNILSSVYIDDQTKTLSELDPLYKLSGSAHDRLAPVLLIFNLTLKQQSASFSKILIWIVSEKNKMSGRSNLPCLKNVLESLGSGYGFNVLCPDNR